MDQWNTTNSGLDEWMTESEAPGAGGSPDPESTIEPVILERTKSGYGLKILVNGRWLYASERAVIDVLKNWTSCTFRPVSSFKKPAVIKVKPRVP